MSRFFLSLVSLVVLQTSGWAQTPVSPQSPPAAADPYELIPVADDQTVIEAKSLILQAGVLGTAQSQAQPGQRPLGPGSSMADLATDMPNAFRCYGFVLGVGEKLRLRLQGQTEGRIFMKFLPKRPADAMASQVRRANLMPAPSRASRIEITNIMDKPYQVALMLYGQANYPYTLVIERTKKK
ncbi:hypothetical protein [Geothrix campi]|uniref:hypothetical protein n=1 Tax=Geothrix campi TaxID=2966450 RepID=UPI0021476E07|nr:hypothetical protein [Geothrix sp. SG10]